MNLSLTIICILAKYAIYVNTLKIGAVGLVSVPSGAGIFFLGNFDPTRSPFKTSLLCFREKMLGATFIRTVHSIVFMRNEKGDRLFRKADPIE